MRFQNKMLHASAEVFELKIFSSVEVFLALRKCVLENEFI